MRELRDPQIGCTIWKVPLCYKLPGQRFILFILMMIIKDYNQRGWCLTLKHLVEALLVLTLRPKLNNLSEYLITTQSQGTN